MYRPRKISIYFRHGILVKTIADSVIFKLFHWYFVHKRTYLSD